VIGFKAVLRKDYKNMISKLSVEGFQSLGLRQEVELAPLTLVFGPNSVGKSSLGRSLRFLAQSARGGGGLVYSGAQVDLSNFQTTVFKQNPENNILLGARVLKNSVLKMPTQPGTPMFYQLEEIVFDFKISASRPEKPATISLNFRINDNSARPTASGIKNDELPKMGSMWIELSSAEPGQMKLESWGTENLSGLLSSLGSKTVSDERTENLNVDFEQFFYFPFEQSFIPVGSREEGGPLETEYFTASDLRFAYATESGNLRSGELIPTQVSYIGRASKNPYLEDASKPERVMIHLFFQELMGIANGILVGELDSVTYCGPIRQISSISVNEGQFAARLLSDGSNIQAVLASLDERAFELLSESLSRISEGYYSLERVGRAAGSGVPQDVGFTQTFLRDTFTGALVAFKDAGAGIAQALPILIGFTALSKENRSQRDPNRGDGLLIVEQPELHLHPKLQGELADVAMDAVSANFREQEFGSVVLFETHSEAILLRVLRRIREGAIDPRKVAFYFVDRLPGSGSSYVDRMEINSDGEFKWPWPLSFSELRISER